MCRKCVAVCPTGAIHELNFPPRKEAAPKVAVEKPAAPAEPVQAKPVENTTTEVKEEEIKK